MAGHGRCPGRSRCPGLGAARAVLLLAGLLLSRQAAAEEPWSVSEDHPPFAVAKEPRIHGQEQIGSSDALALVFQSLLWIYQHVFSPVDGATCSFYPTCSEYGIQALRRHGWLLGGAMALERSMRYHAAEGIYPMIVVHGMHRFHDPLDHNDFWFGDGSEKEP